MKTLFISVPQWYPMNPYPAGAILVGQLKAAGYEAAFCDLNIEFFNDILKKEFVESSLENAKAQLPELQKLADSLTEPEKNFNTYSADVRTRLLRYKTIAEFSAKENGMAERVISSVGDAVRVLKDKERFYEPETLFRAKDTDRKSVV